MKRLQFDRIIRDLNKKMVFITGPRQVGKTHISLEVAKEFDRSVYLNYDNLEHRRIISEAAWLPDTQLLVLDELHKMPEWKNYLKGIYDTKPSNLKLLVTGSARLEVFRQSGDSLAGRFFRHRLNPLSLVELNKKDEQCLDRLIIRGGFPEPYLAEDEVDADRWRLQYIDGLIRSDILDFEKITDFKAMQLTLELLRRRVGSPLSYSSIARDINCSPNTIRRYIDILEGLFIIFRIAPFHRNIARSLLKEPKVYFYDTGMVVGDQGIRLENMVAVSLLKHLNSIEDYQGKKTALNYLRTKEKKEVDFALVIDDKPVLLIECKLTDNKISPSLNYFHKKYTIPSTQIVRHLQQERMINGIELRRVVDFLSQLEL